ncbi:heparinase II/III family protein [Rhodoplanes roseus]|uniref:Heparinase n=1 Tax=Rhodoplanes roseus TaxID=29409 RepID=A0A327KU78_9BRAD|nr:heparinase II/III family protein [Rhodoplanes roseus]RAI41891.1 heparinase [Rhodoplanes roseus]
MSRVSIADRSRLIWYAVRRGLSHVAGRLAVLRVLRIFRWVGRNERIAIAPQSLRTADPTRASEIYAGRFALAGKIVVCDGRSPFEMEPPTADWAASLLGFGWLRHLRGAESTATRGNARALVDEWISLQGGWHPIAWRPEILSRRVVAWLTQASLILADADVRFYRRFLRSLSRQVRFLRWTAGDAQDGVPRLQAYVALTYAALCMTGQIRHLKSATRRLSAELERQILPDGGHVSRNPGALIELLADLLPLAQAFTARNVAPPPALLHAIDRMMPMLRFFRHSDKTFALFNGMGPTSQDLLATILAYDDARGAPVANATHSGYQRIEARHSVVLMDTGTPPPLALSADAHAGCLSFELSSRQQRIVVNCGLPAIGKGNWRHLARATAAHSTVTFNQTSSCDFYDTRLLRRVFGTLISGGPRRIVATRDADDHAEQVRVSHDGYADRFGIIHQRTLTLAADGSRLEGEDIFLPARGEALPAKTPDEFAVRFHLHPTIRVTRTEDGHGVVLTLANKDVWRFLAHEDRVDVEESVFLGGRTGPRRTVQLVIRGNARKAPRVEWTFALADQQDEVAASARRGREQTPGLPM